MSTSTTLLQSIFCLLFVFIIVSFLFIVIVNTEECAGEGAGLAEGDEEGGVDLALGVNEDSAKEKDHASDGKDGGGHQPAESASYDDCAAHNRVCSSSSAISANRV